VSLPDKPLFFILLVAWLALFHFFGNSTFGYKDTSSLFSWLNYAYSMSADDEHGRLIPIVILGLLIWKRNVLTEIPKSSWWPALFLLAVGLLLHIAGFVFQQARVSIVAFFVGLYGLTGLVWGRRWLAASFFPYFLFAFCVPLGTLAESITFPLRMLVTHISVGVGHTLGIELIRKGTQIMCSDGFNLEVAPACSGIRSLTALTALTTIYGFLTFETRWKRTLMVLIAVPLAVVGNIARVSGVLIVKEAFGQEAGMKFHDGAGFVTFAVAIVCVMALGHWLRDDRLQTRLEGQPA
jgi:exosortase